MTSPRYEITVCASGGAAPADAPAAAGLDAAAGCGAAEVATLGTADGAAEADAAFELCANTGA
jgi:hypothetical protein